jgi:hypothetical protein
VQCEKSNRKHYGPNGDMFDQKGGALFGYTDLYGGYSGGQAEYVRVPYADVGPRKVPERFSDEEVLSLRIFSLLGFPAWSGLGSKEVTQSLSLVAGVFLLRACKRASNSGLAKCVGFVLRDDFFEGTIAALFVVVAPAAFRNTLDARFPISDCTADVNPLHMDDDFAILPDGDIARSNAAAMKVDKRGLQSPSFCFAS